MVLTEAALTFAVEKVGEKLVSGISNRLSAQELEQILRQAIQRAIQEQPLFLQPFQADGAQGYNRFLNQFFQGRALQELQKPLDGQGEPDTELLCEAFLESAQGHSALCKVDPQQLDPWMQVFVEAYFKATNSYLKLQLTRADYCDQIRSKFDDIKFAGIAVEGQDIDKAEHLDEIFVMPDIQEEIVGAHRRAPIDEDIPPEILDDPQQRLIWEQRQELLRRKDRPSGRKFSAAEILQQGKANRAVLIGAPGSGKTTLMNYFAVVGTDSQGAQRCAPTGGLENGDWLPILIRIRDLTRHPDLSILEFIQDFAKTDLAITRDLTCFFEYWLEKGQALILLDGLDEVADVSQRYKVVEKIETFLKQFDQCPAVITSRPAGYKRDFFRTDEFPHYELLPFDDGKIDTFIDHWYDSRFDLERERDRRKSSLRKALKDQPRIKQLARNPLLLTIIALIHRYQAKLPKERYKLYDKAVETLLTTWDSNKELSNHEILEYLELDDLRRLMERLAYWIHCQGGVGNSEGGTLIDKDELLKQLTKYIREMKGVERYQAKKEAHRFLEKIVRDRAGLLSLQGQDCYAFVHKTFQEYLTAMEIRDQQEEGFEVVLEHIEEYLHNPHWEEVLLLLTAQQKRKNPTRILEAILAHDTPYEQWLHRNLLFAGKALAEDIPVSDLDLEQRIINQLLSLSIDQSPQVTKKLREAASDLLLGLQETRFQSKTLELIKHHASEIGFWNLLQYREYLGEKEMVENELEAIIAFEYQAIQEFHTLCEQYGESSIDMELYDDRYKHFEPMFDAAYTLFQLNPLSELAQDALILAIRDHSEVNWLDAIGNYVSDFEDVPENFIDKLIVLVKVQGLDNEELPLVLLNLLSSTTSLFDRLLDLTGHESEKVKALIANVLSDMGSWMTLENPCIPMLIPKLLLFLNDDGAWVKANALAHLWRWDYLPDVLRDKVATLLSAQNQNVSELALLCLGQHRFLSDKMMVKLVELLTKYSYSNQPEEHPYCPYYDYFNAAEALSNNINDSSLAQKEVQSLLNNSAISRNQFTACTILANLERPSEEIIMQIFNLAMGDGERLRFLAINALAKIYKKSDAVPIEYFFELLDDVHFEVRAKTIGAVGGLGERARLFQNRLIALLKDEHVQVRTAAAQAIGKIGIFTPEGLRSLFPLLEQKDLDARSKVAEALVRLSQQSNEVLPAIVRWIEHNQDNEFVGNGIDALWEIVH